MKAIVHIGSPKTGTSSIQTFLFRNAEELARRGVRYHRNVPRRGSQYEYPLACLTLNGNLLHQEDARLRYRARTLEEATRNHAGYAEELKSFPARFKEPLVVFSSEHILPWINAPETIARFHEMFLEVFEDVRYLVYLRRQEDLVVSQYSETIKRGNWGPLDELLQKRLENLDHWKVIKRWIDAVGQDRLIVRLLESDCLKDGDLVADFCDNIDVDPAGLQPPPRVNESLSSTGAEVLRHLNRRIPDFCPNTRRNPLRSGLLPHVLAMTQDDPPLALDDAQRTRIRERVAEGNAKLCEGLFPERDELFPEKPAKPPQLSKADVQQRALMVMAEVVVRLRQNQIAPLNKVDLACSITHNDETFAAAQPSPSPDPQTTFGRLARLARTSAGQKIRNLTKFRSITHGGPR